MSPDQDWGAAIAKLEGAIAELKRAGGDGTITFAFSAPDGRASSVDLNHAQAVKLVADMRKERGG